MPVLTPAAARKQIAKGETDPLYLLIGEDEVEKGALAAEFAHAVPEDLRAFNAERLYGGDGTPSKVVSALIDAAQTLPMMVPRRVVIVSQAERVLMARREGAAELAAHEALERYIEQPAPHATVVFVADRLDSNRRLVKLLLRRAVVIECGSLERPSDAARWVREQAAKQGRKIEPAAVRLLTERAGADLMRLRADFERAGLHAGPQREAVTAADVEAVAGPATLQNSWAIVDAIKGRNIALALRLVGMTLDSGAVPYMVLGQLAWIARDQLPPARQRGAVEAVFETDLALKSSGGDPRVLLERLVVQLCDRR